MVSCIVIQLSLNSKSFFFFGLILKYGYAWGDLLSMENMVRGLLFWFFVLNNNKFTDDEVTDFDV